MATILDLVKHYQHSIEKYQHDEKKVLKCIDKLYQLGVTVQHLQDTGVGRTVNALRKESGDVGTAARALVNKWKLMVASEETSDPEDNDATNYNGHGNGKDSDDHLKQSRNSQDQRVTKSSQSKQNEQSYKNGDQGNKRKYHSSEESEHDTKKTRHSQSSETEDTYKSLDKSVKIKPEVSHSESNDSQSDSESDSESSASSDEDSKVTQQIKTEPINDYRTTSSKHSSYQQHKEIKKEPIDSSRNSHSDSSQSNTKHQSKEKESRHSIDKSSSKDRSSSSHKSSSSKDKDSSEKKHKSDKDKEKSSSSKHDSSIEKIKSSTDRHSHSSHSKKDKSHSERQESKSEKHQSSSHAHKSDKEKVKSSSDKDTKEKPKAKESHSSSKHSSSSDKEKSRSNSSKEKSSHSSSKSEKKHSSSNDDNKSKSKASDISDKESSHRQSSSSSHKSKSSSSKSKEDVPKKKKAQTNSEDSEEDGIDCGTGASFAEALGMISPTKSKKKSALKKMSSPNNPFINSDLGPAALLAPTARLAPLLPLEISALPEISPNYKPRPPPKLLPHSVGHHFTEDEAMSQVISSKNQRTKVYSGNKMYGKLPSLYELCVNVLQEHIDALEYTGGVPYEILKPVVDRATPQQLFVLEHYNPYLMEDTDHLWEKNCALRFRNKQRQELETWREMFIRCEEEQEHKLKSLTANIRLTQEAKKAPIKQTKMAYVDSVVKPPRNVARKQAQHGTARAATASPASRVASLAAAPGILRPGAARPPGAAPGPVSSFNKPKKAPLMQKALQFMRGRKR